MPRRRPSEFITSSLKNVWAGPALLVKLVLHRNGDPSDHRSEIVMSSQGQDMTLELVLRKVG